MRSIIFLKFVFIAFSFNTSILKTYAHSCSKISFFLFLLQHERNCRRCRLMSVDVINDISNISKSYEILDPLPGIPGYPDPRLVLNNLCNNTVCLEFHSQYLLFQKSTFQNSGFFWQFKPAAFQKLKIDEKVRVSCKVCGSAAFMNQSGLSLHFSLRRVLASQATTRWQWLCSQWNCMYLSFIWVVKCYVFQSQVCSLATFQRLLLDLNQNWLLWHTQAFFYKQYFSAF